MAADPQLIAAAIAVRARAYAPYSGFPVGAALRDETGAIHLGTNVENAAYPSGTCAEAGAIAAMIAAGGRRIAIIAVAGPDGTLCTPCGGCRQRIREFGAPETPVIVCGPSGEQARFALADLLPESFGPETLAAAPQTGRDGSSSSSSSDESSS